jgi:hypothetical protein
MTAIGDKRIVVFGVVTTDQRPTGFMAKILARTMQQVPVKK